MLPQRKPNRLQGFDYSSDKLYFVTVCVDKMVCSFGHVSKGEMHLNEYGKIADRQWHWLAEQYKYVALHAFVVMPNHIHGIIEINSSPVRAARERPVQEELIKIKSLSELMGAYKTTSSKLIHQAGLASFKWKRSFHDHIIRRSDALIIIENYIENNSQKWTQDRFHKEFNNVKKKL